MRHRRPPLPREALGTTGVGEHQRRRGRRAPRAPHGEHAAHLPPRRRLHHETRQTLQPDSYQPDRHVHYLRFLHTRRHGRAVARRGAVRSVAPLRGDRHGALLHGRADDRVHARGLGVVSDRGGCRVEKDLQPRSAGYLEEEPLRGDGTGGATGAAERGGSGGRAGSLRTGLPLPARAAGVYDGRARPGYLGQVGMAAPRQQRHRRRRVPGLGRAETSSSVLASIQRISANAGAVAVRIPPFCLVPSLFCMYIYVIIPTPHYLLGDHL
mmetsp:Transcript_20381/g.40730  ORF Transcript_20381/g.40730 Transcript_20381/m.40730 type:complete len:268 (+) Transcript_20381:356-1159(+)